MNILRQEGILPLQAPNYRPHLLSGEAATSDWVQHLELDKAKSFMLADAQERPLKTLILYGSLRKRSYSQLLAYEFAR